MVIISSNIFFFTKDLKGLHFALNKLIKEQNIENKIMSHSMKISVGEPVPFFPVSWLRLPLKKAWHPAPGRRL